jgi:hypothetical protein
VCITLATALASFFLMYLSAFNNPHWSAFHSARSNEGQQVSGIATILVTNALLIGAMLLVIRRWRPPFGSFTFLFGVVVFMTSGLQGFESAALVVAALIGGGVADVLVRRNTSARLLSVVVPLVLWAAWYAVYHAVWGLGWAVDLWTGSIILAAMTGVGLSLLAFPPRTGAEV